MIEILRRHGIITIDDEDLPIFEKYNWGLSKQGYVKSAGKINGKSRFFHRFIMNATDPNMDVDHINWDKADNRKCNLRIVTKAENAKNKFTKKMRYKQIVEKYRIDPDNQNQSSTIENITRDN
jgi:hypothetical protein